MIERRMSTPRLAGSAARVRGTAPVAALKSVLAAIFAFRRLTVAHWVRFGRLPRLVSPRSFNERISHRIIFDRDPRLKRLSDKIAVKAMIADLVGPEYAVPLLGQWRRADDIDWDALPRRFVLKPNQSSGPIVIVTDSRTADRAAIAAECASWMRQKRRVLPEINREWGYQDIARFIIAEPLLTAPDGGPADELDVFAFHGKALLFRRLQGPKAARRDAWFDASGRQLAIEIAGVQPVRMSLDGGVRARLTLLAERAAVGFASLRVDFYLLGEKLLIGELTSYSWGGSCVFARPELDALLGRLWVSPDTSILPSYVSPPDAVPTNVDSVAG